MHLSANAVQLGIPRKSPPKSEGDQKNTKKHQFLEMQTSAISTLKYRLLPIKPSLASYTPSFSLKTPDKYIPQTQRKYIFTHVFTGRSSNRGCPPSLSALYSWSLLPHPVALAQPAQQTCQHHLQRQQGLPSTQSRPTPDRPANQRRSNNTR